MPDNFPILQDYDFDGFLALEDVIRASVYKTLPQAVASLTLFSHPETVSQTDCKAVIRVIRNSGKRGEVEEINGHLVGMDDNKSPTDVFLWCNGIKKGLKEVQFNHIYTASNNPEIYTSLANLCVTPAFLAKLTDKHKEVQAMLRYRAFALYGFYHENKPSEPKIYSSVVWAPCLPPIKNVKACFESFMTRRPRDRTTRLAERAGTVFNGYLPTKRTHTERSAGRGLPHLILAY